MRYLILITASFDKPMTNYYNEGLWVGSPSAADVLRN